MPIMTSGLHPWEPGRKRVMSYLQISIAVGLLVSGFLANHLQALQNQQVHFPGSAPNAASSQYTAAINDPIRLLEAKVESLQSQLDSLRATSCVQECNPVNSTCGGGLYLGAAAVFAKPHFKEAFQYSQTNFQTGLQSLVPFSYDYEVTPRVWLGYRNADGFGVRATWWNFDADGQTSSNTADGINIYGAHAVNVIFPANIFAAVPGETLTNTDSLETQIQNYYLTYDGSMAGFEFSGGLGLRYAKLDQSFNSVVQDQAGIPVRLLDWQRQYSGIGPAMSVEAKKRLGSTPFSFVTNAGGAFLFGTKALNRTVLGDQSPQPSSPFLSLDDADEVVGIGELGLGLEWSRPLANRHHLTVRGQYEGQLWAEGGAPTLGFLGFQGAVVQIGLMR